MALADLAGAILTLANQHRALVDQRSNLLSTPERKRVRRIREETREYAAINSTDAELLLNIVERLTDQTSEILESTDTPAPVTRLHEPNPWPPFEGPASARKDRGRFPFPAFTPADFTLGITHGTEWTGIWGAPVDAERLVYTSPLRVNSPFPISAICQHWSEPAMHPWLPQVAFNWDTQH